MWADKGLFYQTETKISVESRLKKDYRNIHILRIL